MPTVFISRPLASRSVFRREMRAAGLEVVGKSLIEFSPVAFRRIPRSNWIFFYSKKAVEFFFRRLEELNRKVPAVRWATLGPGTAKVLKKQGIKAEFIGSGSSLETAIGFVRLAKGQKVLFPRARQSRQSIQDILEAELTAIDLVVYNNQPRPGVQIPICDYLVFTSPMNAQTYFEDHDLQASQKVFAIGRTTAKALTGLGIPEIEIAEEPSEAALAAAVLKSI